MNKVINKLQKVSIISKYYFFYSGNQSILSFFWPIFRILAPLIIGYLTFGQILEQDSGRIPYKLWVISGMSIWILAGSSLNSGNLLLNTRNKRKKFFNLGHSSTLIILSNILPQSIICLFLSFTCFINFVNKQDSGNLILKCFYLLVFHITLTIICVAFSFLVAILNALMRDIKMLSGFFSQYLLWVSPIFYVPRKPNSNLESVLYSINPLNTALEILRNIIFDINSKFTVNKMIILTSIIIFTYLLLRFSNGLVSKLIVIIDRDGRDNLNDSEDF